MRYKILNFKFPLHFTQKFFFQFSIPSQITKAAMHQVPNLVAEHSDEFMSTLQEINRDIQDVTQQLKKTDSIDSFSGTDEETEEESEKNQDSVVVDKLK